MNATAALKYLQVGTPLDLLDEFPLASSGEDRVRVAVNQPGHHAAAAGVDDLGRAPRGGMHVIFGPEPRDAPVLSKNGSGFDSRDRRHRRPRDRTRRHDDELTYVRYESPHGFAEYRPAPKFTKG